MAIQCRHIISLVPTGDAFEEDAAREAGSEKRRGKLRPLVVAGFAGRFDF
jgi:hypothetical protein